MPTFLRRRAAVAATAATLAAALLASGCSLSTETDDTPRLTMSYGTTAVEPSPAAASSVEITGGQQFIQGLGGVFAAPCLQAFRSGRVDVTGTTIIIRVIFRPNNAACSNGPTAAFGYNAYVTNVRPGTYTVRVIHEGDAQVPTGTVVKELSVTVTPL